MLPLIQNVSVIFPFIMCIVCSHLIYQIYFRQNRKDICPSLGVIKTYNLPSPGFIAVQFSEAFAVVLFRARIALGYHFNCEL